MNHGSSGLLLLALYLLIAAYLMPLFPASGSERDLVNRAATASLVERTTFDISKFEKEGSEFRNVRRIDGKVYPASPPGFAVVSAPFYAIARIFLGEANDENLRSGWFTLRFVLSTMPLLLLGIWLFSSEVDAYSLGAFLFATPLFPLSLLYTPDVFVAVLIYLAFRVIFDFERVMPGRCFTAGLFLGFCLLCDVRTILPALVFFVGVLFTGRREIGSRVMYYLAGIVPFAAALVFYSWFVLGSVTELLPLSNFTVPGFYAFYESWLSPAAGIFAYSPLLLFAIGAVFTTKAGGSLRFGVKYTLIVLALVLSVFWDSGESGARVPAAELAIVILLFLDPLFDGEADEYSNLWRGFFFTVALLMCFIPALTVPFAPAELAYPHNSFWRPLLVDHGVFAQTIPGIYGVKGPWVLLFPGIAVLLILFAVLRTARYPARFAIGVLAGFLLMGNYLFFTDLEPEQAKPFVDKVSDVRYQ